MTSTMRFDKWENSLGQPYGTVLQVVSTTKTDTFTANSSSFIDVTGLNASITPKSASNKILVIVNLSLGTLTGSTGISARLLRDSTPIAGSIAEGVRVSGFSTTSATTAEVSEKTTTFFDSPNSTLSTTYKIQVITAGTAYVNRSNTDGNEYWQARAISSITLLEIAQ